MSDNVAATANAIHPKTVKEMTDDELDAEIAQRRERRLVSFKVYQEAQELARERKEHQLKNKLDKQLEMYAKELERLDKLLDKLDQRALNIRGVRLEMGDM